MALGVKQVLAKLVAALIGRTEGLWMNETDEAVGYWVPGGSMVFVPSARLHEIPKVLEEHRRQEHNRARLWFRR